jgi:hypothetical protein
MTTKKPRQTRKVGSSSTNAWREGFVAKREFPGHGTAEINDIDAKGYVWALFNPLGYSRGYGMAPSMRLAKQYAYLQAKKLGWVTR